MIAFLIAYLAEFSYFAIFIFLFLSHFGPIPEEAILIASGYVASLGVGNVWGFVFFCLLGIVTGDSITYWIGRKKGEKILQILGERFHMSQRRLEKTLDFFRRNPRKSVFLSRFLVGFRFLAPYAAGVLKIPSKIFSFYNILAALIWVPLIIFLSYWLSYSFDVYSEYTQIKHIIWILVILIVGFIVGWREFMKD